MDLFGGCASIVGTNVGLMLALSGIAVALIHRKKK